MKISKQAKIILLLIALYFILKNIKFVLIILILGGLGYFTYTYNKNTQIDTEQKKQHTSQKKKPSNKIDSKSKMSSLTTSPREKELFLNDLESDWSYLWDVLDDKIDRYVKKTDKYVIDYSHLEDMFFGIERDMYTIVSQSADQGWSQIGSPADLNTLIRESYFNHAYKVQDTAINNFNVLIDEYKYIGTHKGYLNHRIFSPHTLKKQDKNERRWILINISGAKLIADILQSGSPQQYLKNKKYDMDAIYQQMYQEVQVMEENIDSAHIDMDNAWNFFNQELDYYRFFDIVENNIFTFHMEKNWFM